MIINGIGDVGAGLWGRRLSRLALMVLVLTTMQLGVWFATAQAQFSAAGSGPGSIRLNGGQTGWEWDGGALTWNSNRYNGSRTALARWPVFVGEAGFCRLTACFDADISTPGRENGKFTRTGFTVQLWNKTGIGRRVPADLGAVDVYRSNGHRGQTNSNRCWSWKGNMAKGWWEIRGYVHKNRVTYRQPKGEVTVTKIKLERLR